MAIGGRGRSNLEISLTAFVVSGNDEAEMDKAKAAAKGQLAFYGSTPAYRGVLEHHGWGELQTELNRLSKQGAWQEMAELIDDDMLATFAVIAEPDQVASGLKDRFGGLIDRVGFYLGLSGSDEVKAKTIADLRSA